jgi:predicted Zn-dependent peptidase
VYAGISRKRVHEVMELILKEIHNLKDTVNDGELQRAKNQLKGNIILGLESSSSRMNNIARQEIYYGKYFSPKEIMDEIDSITLKQIKDLAEKMVKRNGFLSHGVRTGTRRGFRGNIELGSARVLRQPVL